MTTANQTTSLAELLERVLDKGIVIAGDITISLAEVELLSIKVRLLVASIDKAREIGINWWQSDPALSTRARQLEDENRRLRERVERLEGRLAPTPSSSPAPVSATPAYGSPGSASSASSASPVPPWSLTQQPPAPQLPSYGPPGYTAQSANAPGYGAPDYGWSIVPADVKGQGQQGPKTSS